jgi:hypothetical protein
MTSGGVGICGCADDECDCVEAILAWLFMPCDELVYVVGGKEGFVVNRPVLADLILE